jgi:hypothetical protein
MSIHLFAVETIGDDVFQVYRGAVVISGIVLVVLAAWGLGATVLARVFSGVTGVVLLSYGGYLWLFLEEDRLYEVYTFLFILPALVFGYHFYSRVLNRKIDASVRAQLEAERAARRAARAELAQTEPAHAEGVPPDDATPPGQQPSVE